MSIVFFIYCILIRLILLVLGNLRSIPSNTNVHNSIIPRIAYCVILMYSIVLVLYSLKYNYQLMTFEYVFFDSIIENFKTLFVFLVKKSGYGQGNYKPFRKL